MWLEYNINESMLSLGIRLQESDLSEIEMPVRARAMCPRCCCHQRQNYLLQKSPCPQALQPWPQSLCSRRPSPYASRSSHGTVDLNDVYPPFLVPHLLQNMVSLSTASGWFDLSSWRQDSKNMWQSWNSVVLGSAHLFKKIGQIFSPSRSQPRLTHMDSAHHDVKRWSW